MNYHTILNIKTGVLLGIIAFLSGCASFTGDLLTGRWMMKKVIQNGTDVTSGHDPYGERYIIIRKDSTFESGGRPFGRNTGKYVFNPADHTLFLDSDAGPDDDSQWRVTIQGDTMHWKGFGTVWAEGFELIHVKTTDSPDSASD